MSSVNLGTVSVANNAGGLVNLNLLAPFTNSNGTYYFVDVDGMDNLILLEEEEGTSFLYQISSVFGGSTSGNFNGYTLSVPSLSEFQAIGSCHLVGVLLLLHIPIGPAMVPPFMGLEIIKVTREAQERDNILL